MTLREFFLGRAVVIALLLLIFLGYFVLRKATSTVPQDQVVPEQQPVVNQPDLPQPQPVGGVSPQPTGTVPRFTWQGEIAPAPTPNDIPKTNVFLAVQYPNGISARRLIDTPDGSCNVLPDKDKDIVQGSNMYLCYAAGFGYRYKIVQGQNSYLVMRKPIEEGSPEYTPPEVPYQAVTEIPFATN